jgi:AraC-like DNA-binding protein
MNFPRTEFYELVAELIELYLPTGECSVSAVARNLRIDRTTLNRRLMRTGHGYLRLLQATRKKRAAQLCVTTQPLGDIAVQLGFANAASFSRWFVSTFGCPVGRWRQSRSTL